MGLQLFPHRFADKGEDARKNGVPPGIAHGPKEICTLATLAFPTTPLGPCCHLDGLAATNELEAFGEADLAKAMSHDMTVDEAAAFAERLTSAIDRLVRKYDGKRKPKGGHVYRFAGGMSYDGRSTFSEAIITLRQTANWYAKVSSLGYGVYAW